MFENLAVAVVPALAVVWVIKKSKIQDNDYRTGFYSAIGIAVSDNLLKETTI